MCPEYTQIDTQTISKSTDSEWPLVKKYCIPTNQIPEFFLWQVQGSQCPNEYFFGPGDLDLWPMTLTFELDLDIHPLDLHAQIQVCMSCLFGWDSKTDGQTDRHTMSKLLHPYSLVLIMGGSHSPPMYLETRIPDCCKGEGPGNEMLQNQQNQIKNLSIASGSLITDTPWTGNGEAAPLISTAVCQKASCDRWDRWMDG